MHSSGTTLATVLPDDVVVTTAPAVVHVEVVTVLIETPLGKLVSVLVMLSAYASKTLVLATPEKYST